LLCQTSVGQRVAVFISPHGFGHAARAAGIMAAIQKIATSVCFEIFTKVPSWFFGHSLQGPFTYHSLLTDIGLVQKDPLQEDMQQTVKHLDDFLPFSPSRISELSQAVIRLKCALIICDIAPLGIAVARAANLPSVLVENFTWDWIYEGYADHHPRITRHVSYLQNLFESADYHVQTEPICCPRADADLVTVPVTREIRESEHQIRKKLNLRHGHRLVMITMGGIQGAYHFLDALKQQEGVSFVIPGGSQFQERRDNLILLPHDSHFFHPDLINACDAVIGKVGYSTLAEVYHAGVPFGYVQRPLFRESAVLTAFIEAQMPGLSIDASAFGNGRWLADLETLLSLPRIQRKGPNGSEQAAAFILDKLTANDRD